MSVELWQVMSRSMDDADFVDALAKWGAKLDLEQLDDIGVYPPVNSDFRVLLRAIRYRERLRERLLNELLSGAVALDGRSTACNLVLTEHSAFVPRTMRLASVEAAVEKSTADRFGPSRRARRNIFKYLRAALQAVRWAPRGDRPPLSKVIVQFRASLVGTLTRNAPPLTAKG